MYFPGQFSLNPYLPPPPPGPGGSPHPPKMGGVFAPLNRGFYPPKPVSARLCALCACCHVHTCTHRAETPTPPPDHPTTILEWGWTPSQHGGPGHRSRDYGEDLDTLKGTLIVEQINDKRS